MKKPYRIDLTGKRFGQLTVLHYADQHESPSGRKTPRWFCRCDCGRTKSVIGYNLRNGSTQSCGCRERGKGESRKYSSTPSWLVEHYARYESGACLRGYEFNLNLDEFHSLVSSDCHYCGSSPEKRIIRKMDCLCNGVDRRNNNVGYILDNCVPCCSLCNKMKSDISEEKFLEHIRRICHHAP